MIQERGVANMGRAVRTANEDVGASFYVPHKRG